MLQQSAKEREINGVPAATPTASCQGDPSCFREQGAEITPMASVVKHKGEVTVVCCFYVDTVIVSWISADSLEMEVVFF